MKSHKLSPEKTDKNLDKKARKSSGWKKVVTTASFALAWFLTSCDKVPNDEIILDSDKQSVAVSFEYQFGKPESGTSVDYNIFARKNWGKFEWIIETKSDWLFTETIRIESDNLDWLFEEIADKSDSEYITENTRARKNDKLAFAKKAYKDNILNKSKKWGKSGKFKIKYKK